MKVHNDVLGINLSVTEDWVWAYVSLSVRDGQMPITSQLIMDFLNENGVVTGIREEAIESLCAQTIAEEVLVAKGNYPIDGKDAVIHYHVDLDHHIKPKTNPDGSTDYKELNFIDKVQKGQVLMEKTPATKGTDGVRIDGKIITAFSGKEQGMAFGKNCRLSEDGLQVISEIDGVLALDGGRLSVQKLIEIHQDVGTATGNIQFDGEVIVHGDILEGMKVVCEKLVVDGVVEGSDVTVNGDLIIHRGVSGHRQAKILTKGNIHSKYINNAVIVADGDIEADAILNCEVRCGHNVKATGRNGCIIGGKVFAESRIDAKTIGSEMGVSTMVGVGKNTEIAEAVKRKQERLKELEIIKKKTNEALVLLDERLAKIPEHKKYNEFKEAYVRNLEAIAFEKQGISKELIPLVEQLRMRGEAALTAQNIYPGVHIDMGRDHIEIQTYQKHYEKQA